MVEKLRFNSLVTAPVDIPACQLHTPSKLETFVALCCVTKLQIFRVAFYCPQHKVDLCDDHAV